VVLVVVATGAEARIGGLNMSAQQMHGVTMMPNRLGGGYGPRQPPPIPCYYTGSCASDRGQTGGFASGGGSGTKPTKKPSLQ
jgi:hypothetical protein